MTSVPVVLHLATLSQLAPIAAGLGAFRKLTSASRWVVAWCAIKTAADLLALFLAQRGLNNLWLGYLSTPVLGTTMLWALSLWQQQPARLATRIAIPLALVAWLALVVLFEDIRTFSTAGEPLYALLCLAAAVYTLGANAVRESEPLLQRDWFWISTGVALYFGSAATLSILSAILVEPRPDIVVNSYRIKSLLDLLAFAAITGGMLCSKPRPRFGAFSSPLSSVSR